MSKCYHGMRDAIQSAVKCLEVVCDPAKMNPHPDSLEASPGFVGLYRKGYEKILEALRPLNVNFQQDFVHDKELLRRLAVERPDGVQAHWETFREVAYAARARLERMQKDAPSDQALSKVEFQWNLLHIAAEEAGGIMATKDKNPHYVLLQEGTIIVLSTEEPELGRERSVSVIDPTADEPLFAQRYILSELSAEKATGSREALESFLSNSNLEVPPQWYYSAKEVEMHKDQLAKQLGKAPTKAPSAGELAGVSASQPDSTAPSNGETSPKPEPSKLDLLIQSMQRLETSVVNGFRYGNEELGEPSAIGSNFGDQGTKDLSGIGFMLNEGPSAGPSDFYLVYPRTKVNGTTGSKRGFTEASTGNLSREQTRSAVESLRSFVSLFQSKPESESQVVSDGREATKSVDERTALLSSSGVAGSQ
jgi:hypothetical protein